MMATSNTFNDFYICELAYWTQDMPLDMYNQMLELYKLPYLPQTLETSVSKKESVKTQSR
jgi:methylamine methyltransferase corrinoid activation protein